MTQHQLAGRLPFQLPDFTRVIWHSAVARDVWQPRIARINTMWSLVERQAVVEGHRNACLTFFTPEDLVEATHRAIKSGKDIMVVPLGITGVTLQYSSTSRAPTPGQPWQYRAVMVRTSDAPAWVDAWKNGVLDNDAVGKLLGYPDCCRAFFDDVWVKGSGVDTTWQMAANTPGVARRDWERGTELRLPAAGLIAGANIMLRWLGVRLVPHLPCSHTCEATAAQAAQFRDLAVQLGFTDEIAWVDEMLNWPVEWSALHGVAELRTPVCTLSTRTDATRGNMVVQREGTCYPDEGSRGLRFPFQQEAVPRVTGKPAFARAFAAKDVDQVWTRNGFGSQDAMDFAHSIVLNALPKQVGTLRDLGCGSGRLLERAQDLGWVVTGVEMEPARAAGATVPITVGDIFDLATWADGHADVTLVMPGRLLEQPEKAAAFMAALAERTTAVLVYAYGDWLADTDIMALSAKAGFKDAGWQLRWMRSGPGAAAALLERTATQ